MNLYDRFLLPPLIHCVCGMPMLTRMRAALLPAALGDVLELGIGSGLNLTYYDPARVGSLTGVDPSAPLLSMARKRATDMAFPVELLEAGAERLPLPDASIDTVVVTFSMCTIPDVAGALLEARRVLKPGGKLLFCEHGLAPEPSVQRWQKRLDPLWGKLAGGCHLTRNIPQLLEQAQFSFKELDSAYLPYSPRFAGYIYRGDARPLDGQSR